MNGWANFSVSRRDAITHDRQNVGNSEHCKQCDRPAISFPFPL